MNIIKLTVIMMCIYTSCLAQNKDLKSKVLSTNNFADLSLGSNGNDNILSVSLGHIHGLGARKQWRLGYGARFSTFANNGTKHYVSAIPSMYLKSEKMDTLNITKAAQSNLVVFISANYRIKRKIELGFNIDLVGYSFATSKAVNFVGNGVTTPTTAKGNVPTALLVGANDLGMLKSEFNIGYQLSNQWMIRLGLNSLLTEYKTDTELQTGNTRFRGTGIIPFVAVRFSPQIN
jgi:hypothetical protein